MRTVVCAHQKLCDIITVVYFAALAVLLAAETEIGQSIATNAAQQIKRTKQKSTMTDFLVYRQSCLVQLQCQAIKRIRQKILDSNLEPHKGPFKKLKPPKGQHKVQGKQTSKQTIYIFFFMIYKLQVYILYNIEIFTRQQSYWSIIIKTKNKKTKKLFTQRILYTNVGRDS